MADIGCVLYAGDEPFTIKKSKLRGVESCGMICAEDEIGVGTDHDGIIVLPEDAPVGQPAAEYYRLESDWIIEVDITANARTPCHIGAWRVIYMPGCCKMVIRQPFTVLLVMVLKSTMRSCLLRWSSTTQKLVDATLVSA